jgi:hypothetical protein
VEEIERSGSAALAPYLLRNDFSRGIGEVFGDHALASVLHRLVTRYHSGRSGDVVPELAAAVRGRYDLTA